MITFSLKCELVTVEKLEFSFPGRIPRIAPLKMKCKTDISENLSTYSKQESFTFLIIFKIVIDVFKRTYLLMLCTLFFRMKCFHVCFVQQHEMHTL